MEQTALLNDRDFQGCTEEHKGELVLEKGTGPERVEFAATDAYRPQETRGSKGHYPGTPKSTLRTPSAEGNGTTPSFAR